MSRASTAPDSGIVLCVGVSPEDFADVARALSGRATVVSAADTDRGRMALLAAAGLTPPPQADSVLSVRQRHRTVVAGALSIDADRREASWHGRALRLPARSFDLLLTLAEDPDRVWTFAELTRRVWRRDYLGDTDAVTSAVKRLRGHLATTAPGLSVDSVRGVGFRLAVPRNAVVPRRAPVGLG